MKRESVFISFKAPRSMKEQAVARANAVGIDFSDFCRLALKRALDTQVEVTL